MFLYKKNILSLKPQYTTYYCGNKYSEDILLGNNLLSPT